MSEQHTMNNSAKPRSRGRPPKTENDQEQIKNHIAQAAVRAFAEHGYHRMNVEHILFHADVSRPTFYKYFRQIEEPLVLGMVPYSQSLIQQLQTALDKTDDPIINAVSAFEVYVNWAKNLGTIMAPVYAEFYDASSPIAAFRLEVVNILLKLIKQTLIDSGRPVPSATMLSLFITGVEFLTFRFLLKTDQSEAYWLETREAMMRLLVATLGNSQDLPLINLLLQTPSPPNI